VYLISDILGHLLVLYKYLVIRTLFCQKWHPQVFSVTLTYCDSVAISLTLEHCPSFVNRCYYIALSFLSGQKWAEAMALFQRATAYANKAKNDKSLPSKLTKANDQGSLIERKAQYIRPHCTN